MRHPNRQPGQAPGDADDASVLVVYATTHGHTAKIAERVAGTLFKEGLAVDLRDVAHAADTDPSRYGGVVVAASVHRERHQPEIVAWVRAHREALAGRPAAFLSVSLTAAEDSEEARAPTQRMIDEFRDQTGWAPQRSLPVAGALEYREYDVFTRQLMRLLMRRAGHPTDASQDYDYTDWDAVERCGREFAQLVRAPVRA